MLERVKIYKQLKSLRLKDVEVSEEGLIVKLKEQTIRCVPYITDLLLDPVDIGWNPESSGVVDFTKKTDDILYPPFLEENEDEELFWDIDEECKSSEDYGVENLDWEYDIVEDTNTPEVS